MTHSALTSVPPFVRQLLADTASELRGFTASDKSGQRLSREYGQILDEADRKHPEEFIPRLVRLYEKARLSHRNVGWSAAQAADPEDFETVLRG